MTAAGGAPAEPGTEPGAARRRPTPWRAFWGRFAIGHFLAYPVGFLTAMGSLPWAMMVRKRELLAPDHVGARSHLVQDAARNLRLSGIEAAQIEMVLEFAMWVSIAVLVVMHLAVLPWSFAAARAARNPAGDDAGRRRGVRIFGVTTATTVVLVAVIGTGGWIYVLSR